MYESALWWELETVRQYTRLIGRFFPSLAMQAHRTAARRQQIKKALTEANSLIEQEKRRLAEDCARYKTDNEVNIPLLERVYFCPCSLI